jgi:hypothetical protein
MFNWFIRYVRVTKMLISLAKIGSAGDDRSHLWIDPPKSLSHSLEAMLQEPVV